MPEYQPLLDGSQSFDDEEWIGALRSAGGAGPTIPGRERSEQYLQQHWIPLPELLAFWTPLLQAVFRPLASDAREADPAFLPVGPEAGFAPGWTALAWHAGAPLFRDTYLSLQAVMEAAGDRSWALIERPHYGRWPDRQAFEESPVVLYRLRFMPSATWAEVNGDRDALKDPEQAATSVSGDLFTLGREDYFVVGDTATWALAYRGGAFSGQCVLGVSPRLRAVAEERLADLLAHDGGPEVLLAEETPAR